MDGANRSSRRTLRAALLALVLALALAGLQPLRGQEAPAGGPAGPATDPPAAEGQTQLPWFRGVSRTRYWLRRTSDATDQDVYQTLALDLGDAERHAVTGYLYGRLAADLDGERSMQPFASLDDSFDGSVLAHLHEAYADFHRADGFSVLRLGRQVLADTPEYVLFDGLRAESAELGPASVVFGAYGGAAVHLWEASPSGDWLTGAFVQGRPWDGGRLRLDFMYIEDESLLGPHANDLLGASWWQSFGELVRLEASYTRLEDRDRDAEGRLTFSDPESDWLVQVFHREVLSTQRDYVVELDPFYTALQELFPYRQSGVLASTGVFEQGNVQAGADLRRVDEDTDIGPNNRDYERYHLTGSVVDLGVDGFELSLTGELWESDDQNLRSWGGDATYRYGARSSASLGTFYSLYKFDLALDLERDHVRTWYLNWRHGLSPSLDLELAAEFEQDDFDDYTTFRSGITWRF